LIDKVKDNVHMADIFVNCSLQRCNELLFDSAIGNSILSVHYKIRREILQKLGGGEVR